ncbi:hypothetical protein GJ698_23505 [Pseudoduganella sp. FT26W]|uniref:DNA-binding protein n=1 Tax=Duganella aquatilis TaxID=2666082 RepID=A0A844DF42_9BURK|nr:hypothetical protein [Duganella aquatilis]MRW87040.1 hypothetical protein [Duganella aquatilis]
MPTIYLETSVIYHLTDPPSTNPITRACQLLTQQWWEMRMDAQHTYVSDYVIDDINADDALRAASQLKKVAFLNKLPRSKRADNIAELLVLGGGLIAKSKNAAAHIACAAAHRADILLTWNCTDIANAYKLPLLRDLVQAKEEFMPQLITPFELMGNIYEDL